MSLFNKSEIEIPQKGWPSMVIEGLIPNRVRKVHQKFILDYSFQIDALIQKMNKFEIERKCYGNLTINNFLIPVIVDFYVGEDEEIESNLRILGEKSFNELREYTGRFCFNTSYINKDYSEKEIPFLDFTIYLFHSEWKRIFESFWLNKLNKNLKMRMAVRVEFPDKPDPINIVDKSIQSSLKISRFWIDGLLSFNGDALMKNPIFLDDLEDLYQ